MLISSTTNKPIHYEIRYNPTTLTGVTFNDVHANSMAQISVTGITIVGGLIVNSGYIESKGSESLFTSLSDLLNNIPKWSSEIVNIENEEIDETSSLANFFNDMKQVVEEKGIKVDSSKNFSLFEDASEID